MSVMKKTTLAKAEVQPPAWVLFDAAGQVVGRLAVAIAVRLMGKHRPDYTPSIDLGDGVVVTNCEKVVFTGAKWDKKVYRRHSGYIGGLKELSARKILASHPDRIIYLAVKRMLPKGKLGERMIRKLKIYSGPEHPHVSQRPVKLAIN
ncbi:MAG: 50S ribosomal protein L13 [Planctomycetota bacterium]|jgi:large subunit ribosomal protein L13|nr:50S ribosomal protein L13 [Planctomycetota bacterium]